MTTLSEAVRTLRRFESKVRKTDGCWFWTEALNENGYGMIRYKGRPYRAHRLSYELFRGEIREGHDNQRDMILKGRHRNQ